MNHSNDFNFHSQCCHPRCTLGFNSFIRYSNHISNKHIEKELNTRRIKCHFKDCNQIIQDIHSLYKHFYTHLSESALSYRINCFYKDCNHVITTKLNFTTHLSRYHSEQKIEKNLKEDLKLKVIYMSNRFK